MLIDTSYGLLQQEQETLKTSKFFKHSKGELMSLKSRGENYISLKKLIDINSRIWFHNSM